MSNDKLYRNAYLLTTNPLSERTVFSKTILENIGFNVILFQAIKHHDNVISNKLSMNTIYNIIYNDRSNTWSYVFEDDINILEPISLNEIIEYEGISNNIMYLGLCRYGDDSKLLKTKHKINNNIVYKTLGNTRGLHANWYNSQR